MEKDTMIKIYLAFIVILVLAILALNYLDNNYSEDLFEEYDVDVDKGDELYECADGSYDVYRPYDKTQLSVCGQFLTG